MLAQSDAIHATVDPLEGNHQVRIVFLICLLTSFVAAGPRALKIAPLSKGGTALCKWDQAECIKRCKAGNARSCSRAGDMIASEPQRSVYKKKACDLGDPRGCALFADSIDMTDHARAMSIFAGACEREISYACWRLGDVSMDQAIALDYRKRACKLGDGEICVSIAFSFPDAKSEIAAEKVLRGGPYPSKEAARALSCAAGHIAILQDKLEMACVLPDGRRDGPYMKWMTDEDLDEGLPAGLLAERGEYIANQKTGEWTTWNSGEIESKGTYAKGLQEGVWLIASRRDSERGSFTAGVREGLWVETRGDSIIETPYVHGKKQGIEIEKDTRGNVRSRSPYKNDLLDGTQTTEWPGERCTQVFVAGKGKPRTCTPSGK